MNGSNTYTGATNLAGSVLNLGNGYALGSTSSLLFAGGTLQYSTANYYDYSTAISNAPNQAISIDTNGQNVTYLFKFASVGGSLTKLGSGILSLFSGNNYTAGTNLAGGEIDAATPAALGSGTISFTGGSLEVDPFNKSDYSTRFSNAANQLYSVDTNGQTITYAAALASTGGSLTKFGNGTLILTGNCTYTGGTNISAGTLQIGNRGTTGTLGTGAIANAGRANRRHIRHSQYSWKYHRDRRIDNLGNGHIDIVRIRHLLWHYYYHTV